MDSPLSVIDAVTASVGGGEVRRAIPTAARRTIGAWCFLDHYGPDDIDGTDGMTVGPHPHIGLQTVSWLLAGEVVHSDSLGNEQAIRPGQLNVMTAGRGIAHAEVSPTPHPPVLHGTQLWVALPEGERDRAPGFSHIADIPVTGRGLGGWEARVLVGSFIDVTSPAVAYTPLVGVELSTLASRSGSAGARSGSARAEVPLDPAFEHGLVVLSGQVALPDLAPLRPGLPGDARSGAGVASRGAAGPTVVGPTVIGPAVIGPDRLVVAPAGRSSLTLSTDRPTRALLLGGTPWKGPLVMWWNFVGATAAEVEAARDDWQAGRRFGATAYAEVPGVGVPRIPAPPLLPGRLISRT